MLSIIICALTIIVALAIYAAYRLIMASPNDDYLHHDFQRIHVEGSDDKEC